MKEERYKRSIDNDIVMDIKGKILDILALVMNMHDDKRLTIFLTEFHKFCNQMDPKQVEYMNQMYKATMSNDIREIDKLKKNENNKAIEEVFSDNGASWIRTAYADKKMDLQKISTDSDFISILLDINLYENPALVSSAFNMLVRYFEQQKKIVILANTV
jgi:hypothetical protein